MVLVVHGTLILWLLFVPCLALTRLRLHVVLGFAAVFGILYLPMVMDHSPGGADGSQFLPLTVPGLTFLALTKYKVISLSLLLAVLVSGGGSVPGVRLSFWDLPMLVWCVYPLPSVLGSPPPDGGSALVTGLGQCFSTILFWGVPYFIGKFYFGTLARLRDLAFVYVLGAISYIPLCLWEVRMSPQLHVHLYGFAQHEFQQTIRLNGYRPMVFMQHGLAVSLFMVGATLTAAMLWWSGAARPISKISRYSNSLWFPAVVGLLSITTILTRSSGALFLGLVGAIVLASVYRLRTRLLLLCLILAGPVYITARTSGAWSGNEVVQSVDDTLGHDRSGSLGFRLQNENMLMEQAFRAPLFGWAGWSRNFVRDQYGKILTIPDGLWIIILGERGFMGLTALWLAMLLPIIRFMWSQPVATWLSPQCAAATTCAVVVALYMADNLMNNMTNQVYMMMAAGLSALSVVKVAKTPPPLSVTDWRVFRWSLAVSRRRRARMQGEP